MPPPVTSAAPTLGFLIHDVARLLRRRFEQHARELGLTRSQWQTLAYLAPNEGIQQAGLAELLEIEPITLVRILDRLEARGLVERRAHPTDRRSKTLYLTETARPLLSRIRALGDLTRAEALAGLTAEDRAALTAMLTTMKSNLLEACSLPAITPGKADHG
ncbi:MAG TPA: MarR family transcriptional regulator [Geminicoccus sp.]|uniref:MarR family winged helix-turn-helix transcriptional regulator n=1 Tax=Geminicoccus sp. TaxID=2024832 RepID=UPI002CAC6FF1|nr:MarR family transcriptional regulator [Geminicoccus sp.]HWL70614.1 MarR family transcriptional regulator [Geminicoccus sp.]